MSHIVKLKLDENLNDRHARLARERGHDASTVVAEGLCSASDDTLLEVARLDTRVLITLDKHLSNTIQYPPKRYAGIVVLRVAEPITPHAIERAIGVFLDTAAARNPAGRLWVIDRERVREFAEPELP